MKFQDATDLIPKFKSLIGKPTNNSVITEVYTSFIEKALAKEHLRSKLMGVQHPIIPEYEGDYTLWVMLENNEILSVRAIVINDNIEDLLENALLLD